MVFEDGEESTKGTQGCLWLGEAMGRVGLFIPRGLEEAAPSSCLPPPAFQPPASASTQSPTKQGIER